MAQNNESMTKLELLEVIAKYKESSKPTTIKEHDIVELEGKVATIDGIYFSDMKLEWNIKLLKGRKKTSYALGDWKTYGECTHITDETVLKKVENPCNLEHVENLKDEWIRTDSISRSEELESLIKKELDKCPHSWKNISGWNYSGFTCRYCGCCIEDEMFSYNFEK